MELTNMIFIRILIMQHGDVHVTISSIRSICMGKQQIYNVASNHRNSHYLRNIGCSLAIILLGSLLVHQVSAHELNAVIISQYTFTPEAREIDEVWNAVLNMIEELSFNLFYKEKSKGIAIARVHYSIFEYSTYGSAMSIPLSGIRRGEFYLIVDISNHRKIKCIIAKRELHFSDMRGRRILANFVSKLKKTLM